MIEGFLNQTVSIAARTSFSGGRSVFGTGTLHGARVESKRRMFFTKEGQQVFSTVRIYLSPDAVVSVTDQVTLPDGNSVEVLDVATHYDGNGTAVYKVVTA